MLLLYIWSWCSNKQIKQCFDDSTTESNGLLVSLQIKVGLKRLVQHYMQSCALCSQDLEKWVVTSWCLPRTPFTSLSFASSSSLLAGQFQTHSVAADVTVFLRMHRDTRGQRHQALQHLGNGVVWVFLWGIAITLREWLGSAWCQLKATFVQ